MRHNADTIFAGVGLAIGVAIVTFSYIWQMQQQDIGVIFILASVLYLVLRKKFATTISKPLSANHKRRVVLITNVVFLVAFAVSILLLNNLYYRPPIYFIMVAIAAASIALEIFHTSEDKRHISIIILKIIVLSVAVRAGMFYEFPTLLGSDEWFHVELANALVNTGHMPSAAMEAGRANTVYQDFATIHMLIAITQTILSISAKSALFASIGLISVLSTVFIYLIGKCIGGFRLGLIAMLLFNLSDMMLVRGITNITPGSLVLCCLLFLLYLVFRQNPNTRSTLVIMLLLLLVMILTHQLAVFASLLLLIGVVIGKWLYERYYEKEQFLRDRVQVVNLSYVFVATFIIGTVAYWMYYLSAQTAEVSFFNAMVDRLRPVFQREFLDPKASPYVIALGNYSIISNMLYHVGYLILLFFSTLGALIWLSFKRIRKARFSLVVATLLLFIVIYGSPLGGLQNMLIPHRLLPMVYIILALLAAEAIISLAGLLTRKWFKGILASMVVLLFTFFMITTPFVSPDTPYLKERSMRTGRMQSEIQAMRMVVQAYKGVVMIEGNYCNMIQHMIDGGGYLSFIGMQKEIDSNYQGMIVLGQDLLVRETHVGGLGTFGSAEYAVLGQDYLDMVDQIPGSNLIYNNNELIIYIIR